MTRSLPLLLVLSLGLAACPSTKDDSPADDTADSDGPPETDADGDGFPIRTDCDDEDPDSFPGATELCDGIDNDCDGTPDDGATIAWYRDGDQDGYGDSAQRLDGCDQPEGYVEQRGDCDDGDPGVNPAAVEVCNGRDDDCDAATPEAGLATFFPTSGEPADWTDQLAGGAVVELSRRGTLGLCDGTWRARLRISSDVYVGSPGLDADAVVLDAGGAGTAVVVDGQSLDVELGHFTITNGAGDTPTAFGEVGGGGLACSAPANLHSAVRLTDMHIVANTATYAGGVYSDACDLTLDGSLVSDNVAGVGGAWIAVDGSHRVGTGSAITDNVATEAVGGAYFIGRDERPSAVFGAAVIEGNTTSGLVGGLALVTTDARWNDTSGGAALVSNADDAGVAALYLYDSTLDVDGVDFGTSTDGRDNDPHDLWVEDLPSAYMAPADARFTCSPSGCGASVEHSVGGYVTAGSGNYALLAYGRATRAVTIDGIAMYLTLPETCEIAFYVYSRTSAGSGTWTEEWTERLVPGSGRSTWYSSSRVGIVTTPGLYYAVGAGWDCTTTGLAYYYDNSYLPSTDDLGFGTSEGYVWRTGGLVSGDTSLSQSSSEAVFPTRVYTTEL